MTQYVHKISNSYLDLPTDYWVPTTERLKPMRSYQWLLVSMRSPIAIGHSPWKATIRCLAI